MQRVKIEWDLSDSQCNVDISEIDLPTEVEVNNLEKFSKLLLFIKKAVLL